MVLEIPLVDEVVRGVAEEHQWENHTSITCLHLLQGSTAGWLKVMEAGSPKLNAGSEGESASPSLCFLAIFGHSSVAGADTVLQGAGSNMTVGSFMVLCPPKME
jgi:hypothetical protein